MNFTSTKIYKAKWEESGQKISLPGLKPWHGGSHSRCGFYTPKSHWWSRKASHWNLTKTWKSTKHPYLECMKIPLSQWDKDRKLGKKFEWAFYKRIVQIVRIEKFLNRIAEHKFELKPNKEPTHQAKWSKLEETTMPTGGEVTEEGEARTFWRGESIDSSLWKTVLHYLSIKYRHTPWSSHFILAEFQQKWLHMCTKEFMYTNVTVAMSVQTKSPPKEHA